MLHAKSVVARGAARAAAHVAAGRFGTSLRRYLRSASAKLRAFRNASALTLEELLKDAARGLYAPADFPPLEQITDASGELNELHWLTLNEARQLDLPAVTRWAIDLVERRIQLSPAEQLKQTTPFVRFAKGQEISIDL